MREVGVNGMDAVLEAVAPTIGSGRHDFVLPVHMRALAKALESKNDSAIADQFKETVKCIVGCLSSAGALSEADKSLRVLLLYTARCVDQLVVHQVVVDLLAMYAETENSKAVHLLLATFDPGCEYQLACGFKDTRGYSVFVIAAAKARQIQENCLSKLKKRRMTIQARASLEKMTHAYRVQLGLVMLLRGK